jgi:hypothetical protein
MGAKVSDERTAFIFTVEDEAQEGGVTFLRFLYYGLVINTWNKPQ